MPSVTLKIDNLEALLKALKKKPPVARIGVLDGGARAGNGPSNATIGAFHEFGTSSLPVRSFLRMPINDRLMKDLQKSGAFSKDVLSQVIKQKTVVPWLRLVLVAAEGVIADAFDTGGFGKWAPSNMAGKTNAQTLVETGQLRDSITSEVVEE